MQSLKMSFQIIVGVEDHEQPADIVQEPQHADGLQSICANLELAGNMLLNSFDKQLDLGVETVSVYSTFYQFCFKHFHSDEYCRQTELK
jgi:hypothetical protein